MKNQIRILLALTALTIVLSGCGSDDNRQPSQAEIKAADQNRQNFINNLNVPEDQKAQMRAHMGGPEATNMAAQAAAGNAPTSPEGRRR